MSIEDASECPVCGGPGLFRHGAGCPVLSYVSDLIDSLADELEWASGKVADAGIGEGHMWAAGRLRECAADLWP